MIKSFGNKVAHELADGRVSSKHARKIPRNHVQRATDLLQFMEGSIDVYGLSQIGSTNSKVICKTIGALLFETAGGLFLGLRMDIIGM